MTFDDLKQKAEEVWAKLRGTPEPERVVDFPMRSDKDHVIRANGEAFKPVAREDLRLISVNGTVYRTTKETVENLRTAAGTWQAMPSGSALTFEELFRRSLMSCATVRVPQAEQGATVETAFQVVRNPVAFEAVREIKQDRGMSR